MPPLATWTSTALPPGATAAPRRDGRLRRALARLGAPWFTLAGFALLALGLLAWRVDVRVPQAAVVVPLALLAFNLAAAMVLRPALRRGGLGLFHAALLALLLLAGWGRLNHFDAHVEVASGTPLDVAQLQIDSQGPLHQLDPTVLQFEQGPIRIDYAPGLNRGHTHSQVQRTDAFGRVQTLTVGDDQPLQLGRYRLYTSPNKGHAVLLSWQGAGMAEPLSGVLHFPSYPLLDWRQQNEWTAPDGQRWRVRLQPDQPVPNAAAWTFAPDQAGATLVIEPDGGPGGSAVGPSRALRPGESVVLGGTRIGYVRLTGWMGYRVFHDPTLGLLLWVALAGVAGLGWHLRGRLASLPQTTSAGPALCHHEEAP
ncbi:MAG: hypothetical protein RLY71_2913 [Pseudomonadota bacterium]|jgi:cytochrome c biogenesis protein